MITKSLPDWEANLKTHVWIINQLQINSTNTLPIKWTNQICHWVARRGTLFIFLEYWNILLKNKLKEFINSISLRKYSKVPRLVIYRCRWFIIWIKHYLIFHLNFIFGVFVTYDDFICYCYLKICLRLYWNLLYNILVNTATIFIHKWN